MKKRKIIVPAMLSILGCTAVIAGSTYALFTSEAKVNIAITSGKVDVTATMDALEAYSPKSISLDGTIADPANSADNENDEKTFANGGNASLKDNELTLSKVTPGDKATFNITVKNNSTVKALYRIVIGCEKDDGLFAGLNVSFDAGDIDFAQNVSGITSISKYASIEPSSADKVIKVSVELPAAAGNAYSGKTCSISCKVEAVQGNTVVEDQEDGSLQLYSATDLVNYGKLEAACTDTTSTIAGYTTIELMNDVDMKGIEWTPIMSRFNFGNPLTYGELTFDGNEHTINNLTADEVYNGKNYFSGFFGRLTCMTVQNLTIDNATITGTHYAGGIVGQALYSSNIINCAVTNSSITSNTEDYDGDGKYDNGDKVGGIVGQFNGGNNGAKLDGCTVDKCQITGYRDLGGLVGYAGGIAISNNKVSNTTVTSDHTHNYNGYNTVAGFDVHEIVGEEYEGCTLTNNTYDNVTVINNTVCDTLEGAFSLTAGTFSSDSTNTEAISLDGKNQIFIEKWTDAYITADTTIKNVSFLNGAVFNVLKDGVTVTLEGCTFYACDQSKLTYTTNNSLTNSGSGMCLNLEKKAATNVNYVIKNCTFVGENDATLPVYGNKYNADGSVADAYKKRAHAIALDAIAGGDSNGGSLGTVSIENCEITGVRGNAIQLYGTTGNITIKDTKINSWGVNSGSYVNAKNETKDGNSAAIRGDYTANGSRKLNLSDVYFGLNEGATSNGNILTHVYVGDYAGNTSTNDTGTRVAGTYSYTDN